MWRWRRPKYDWEPVLESTEYCTMLMYLPYVWAMLRWFWETGFVRLFHTLDVSEPCISVGQTQTH